jgi:membrane protease YdiL (CAAX protease family)
MNRELRCPPGFWSTVWLLLGATSKRAAGRRRRQRQLLQQRSGRNPVNWGGFGFVLTLLVMAMINGMAAFVVSMAVESAERVEAERQGKIVVTWAFLELIKTTDPDSQRSSAVQAELDQAFSSEAREIAREYGGSRAEIEQKLRQAVRNGGSRDLITAVQATPGLTALPRAGVLTAMVGSLVLFWWATMLVFQGEGLELDMQRRRHPMWEWLFSHPVPPGAIFLAEMLSPLAANPIFVCAPVFVGFLYGFVYGPELGFLAVFLVGIPVTVAAACLGKALEIGVNLRFSSRSRGAVLGFMSWIGYVSMVLFFIGLGVIPKVVPAISKYLDSFTVVPWPWLSLFLGGQGDGSFSFAAGLLACWAGAVVVGAGAVGFSVWGSQQGLSGKVGRADAAPARAGRTRSFGREPLYRKELLWFVRDRSAVVQALLIPLTMAAVQLFNFRAILKNVQEAWNYLAGAAILFGTYFLWILGPRSLASEGRALWIALTWPRGLENLLKAKAWLWSMISTGLVLLVLGYAVFLFPADLWKIGLLGIAWFFFSRSMAEKSVTLVSVTAESGEVEKIPQGRRWAASLGMLTFSIGVFTQQWHLAVIGIVYSYLTAAAMWENFRAHLPYLYDPWSEKLPPPPTLMHAMIAISILVESAAVVTGFVVGVAGTENIAIARAIGYGICSTIVFIGMATFLRERGVSREDVWRWGASAPAQEMGEPARPVDKSGDAGFIISLLAGAGGGLALGLVAYGYTELLQHIPVAAEMIRRSQEQIAKLSGLKASYAVMAVGFAPIAEEYLFRGLLFRSLDREWGGWRAVLGSAAFFAIYHPPLSWLPVGLLGVANALLFKKSGRLFPAVLLHMVYNAVVLLLTF